MELGATEDRLRRFLRPSCEHRANLESRDHFQVAGGLDTNTNMVSISARLNSEG